MSQDERMTSEELEFLAKRNKAINFKEGLTSQKKDRVFKAYQDALPMFKSSLICVNGLADGVDVSLIDYDLVELDATDFTGENQERSIIFSFSMGSSEPNYFIIVPQHELDRMVKGDYADSIHQFAVVLTKYYGEISKNFPEPLRVKAVRVEELGDAIQSHPNLIEGDYEVKYFELSKNGLLMGMKLLADINVMTALYDGIEAADGAMKNGADVERENEKEEATAEAPEMINSVNSFFSEGFADERENSTLSTEGNVMKKEFLEGEQAALYKPKFGELSQTEQVKGSLGDEFGLLGGVPMEITVVLGSTRVLLSEVKDFGVGRIIELNKSEDDPLLIYLNGELLAEGEVVIVDENYAIKITKLYQEKVVKTGI